MVRMLGAMVRMLGAMVRVCNRPSERACGVRATLTKRPQPPPNKVCKIVFCCGGTVFCCSP
eukprot:4266978-Pyramimonas_sp.AAC.1